MCQKILTPFCHSCPCGSRGRNDKDGTRTGLPSVAIMQQGVNFRYRPPTWKIKGKLDFSEIFPYFVFYGFVR